MIFSSSGSDLLLHLHQFCIFLQKELSLDGDSYNFKKLLLFLHRFGLYISVYLNDTVEGIIVSPIWVKTVENKQSIFGLLTGVRDIGKLYLLYRMFGHDLKIKVQNPMGDVERLVRYVHKGDGRLGCFSLESDQVWDENCSCGRASDDHGSRPFSFFWACLIASLSQNWVK